MALPIAMLHCFMRSAVFFMAGYILHMAFHDRRRRHHVGILENMGAIHLDADQSVLGYPSVFAYSNCNLRFHLPADRYAYTAFSSRNWRLVPALHVQRQGHVLIKWRDEFSHTGFSALLPVNSGCPGHVHEPI